MKKILAPLLLLILSTVRLSASDAERLFAEGNKSFEQKEFQKAVDIYEQLVASGFCSADLEYNLGNAWFRLGSTGRAILHYERALVMAPNHDEASKNLAFVRKRTQSNIEALPSFFLIDWWKSARSVLTSTNMGIVALVLWWSGFAALAFFWLFGKSRQQRKWGLLTGCAFLLISLLPFSLAVSRSGFEANTRQAILVQKTAILRSAPEESSQEVLTIAEGTKLQQLESLEGWWQVQLENGEIGWLPEQAMERI